MSAITTNELVIPTGTWVVDPVHTSVGFQVTETTNLFSTINGRFTDVEGHIEGGETPSLAGTVRVASLRTDNEQRDAHLISPDFLEGEKHPEIHFASKSVEPLEGERFLVRGDVIVKGTPFEIELEAERRGLGRGQAGDERLLIDARGSLDWGTTTVEITAAVSAVKET
jgi:polyisoprenoid-binding protein YceI